MNEVLEFLKKCGVFYIATCDETGHPRVRPFGAVCSYQDKLYFVTNNQKAVYRQLLAEPRVEISGRFQGQWIRITGNAVPDASRQARVAMMDACGATLSSMYTVDDGLMEVFYLENAAAIIYSFSDAPRQITL